MLKFIYSEKATKFCEIFTLLLSYVVPVKSKVKISQNFVVFSEYPSFTKWTNESTQINHVIKETVLLDNCVSGGLPVEHTVTRFFVDVPIITEKLDKYKLSAT